jgi:uncharacterized protein
MKRLLIFSSVALISLLIFFLYCYLETRWIKTVELEIQSTDIPKSFDGKRIVFISDIHHGPYLSIERIKNMVNRINKLHPDIILLGGDYVHHEAKYITPFFDEIKKLKANIGIYGVLGNHDHWEDPELTRKLMLRNGINLCDNQSYWIKIGNDSIKIGGVGDLWEDVQLIDFTIHDTKKNDFCVLLSHNPDYLESLKTDKVDLTLSGHTHGGQVTFFGTWAPILPSKFEQKYRYGLKDFGNMKSYISSGIGTITPPLRFFCRPEIVLVILKRKS